MSTNLKEISSYFSYTLVPEWNASVGNLSLYLFQKKKQIEKKPKDKLKLQLEALEAVLWVYNIVHSIYESYNDTENNKLILSTLSKHSMDMNLSIFESNDSADFLIQLGIITRFELNEGKARFNTFYKHFMALEHANYLFETMNNDEFLKMITLLEKDKSIFQKISGENYIPYSVWTKPQLDKLTIAKWLLD